MGEKSPSENLTSPLHLLSHAELIDQCRLLQLKISTFAATEQQLINTRNELDNEVLLHQRMLHFNKQAFNLTRQEDFLQWLAESIVNIFEVESSAVFLCENPEDPNAILMATEGLDGEKAKTLWNLMQPMVESLTTLQCHPVDKILLEKLATVAKFDQLMVITTPLMHAGHKLTLIAANTVANSRHYIPLQAQRINALAVFTQQAMSHYINHQKTLTLEAAQQRIERVANEMMVKNRQLKKINAELDQFVYSVSHDLRTPLLAIKGLMTLMEMEGNSEADTKEYWQMMGESTERLDETILEILEYSKNNRTDVKIEPVSLEPLLINTFKELCNSYPANVKLNINITDDCTFSSDKSRLKTVFRNLIRNSLKYGTEENKTTKIDISAQVYNNDNVLITIADNGPGIAVQHHSKIFEMFYKISANTPVSGLGLYICKEILNKVGGEIWFESELGKGTVFFIRLPNRETE